MESVDLIVIGGGIHGAGVAQAAAAAGYDVLVLEQRTLAFGTSSRSSKLIHGGLRYLESAQFALVRECLRERTLLLRLAPELVKLRPFHIPVYSDTSRRPWQLRIGLALYSLLGGLAPGTRFRTLPRNQWETLDGLNTQGLQRVFQYWDAQTDDAALTRAVMGSAQTLGARLEMPAAFLHGEVTEQGVVAHYESAGQQCSCQGRVLVNAAGPWVNQVLAQITPQPSHQTVDLVQGSHIVLAGRLQQGFYYLEALRDRRAVFAMPWRQRILIGTTEVPYHGDPAAVAPTPEEIDYLLETFGHYFPAYRDLQREQVREAFAGLRVLPAGPERAFNRPRDTILHPDREQQPRLLSIYGGKLTAYRATAEKVMARLTASLPARKPRGDTRKLMLRTED
ncbi:MAG: glycerol-3-phosphate dehydrogenase/oxidase [Gammaproteobacteria bacterium]